MPGELGRAASRRLGSTRAALLLGAACVPVVLGVGMVLGLVAVTLQDRVDGPFWTWSSSHPPGGLIERQLVKIGILADIPMVQVLAVLSALVLAVVYARRWWVPVAVVGFALVVERLCQELLAAWIDRGHPVGTTGTFFSGGVARTLTVYGAVLACALLAAGPVARWQRRLLWSGLAGLGLLVGVSRAWLREHWLTDVVAAFPIAALLLAFTVAVAAALGGPARAREPVLHEAVPQR